MGKIKTIILYWVQKEDKQKTPTELFKDTEILNKLCSVYRLIRKNISIYTILSLALYPFSMA